ncbi:hypothetical protein ACHAXA_003590 [Cyclostephanos tholiformis]|uniref:Uncharacterized protein n=1 Tax=Cyclostephanos tholiformis TaxID=382380 RepID=A0ABD3R770_9STRA
MTNDANNGIVIGRGLYGVPMEIHASMQQTVTCVDGIAFAVNRTNATRVVSGALTFLFSESSGFVQPRSG